MTTLILPARPSLESLRKQAKKLVRDIAAGDANAIARARTHLANHPLTLSQRDAQLVLAREYGYAGWRELTAEVRKRLGSGLDSAISMPCGPASMRAATNPRTLASIPDAPGIEFAFVYAKPHLIPLLTRVWPVTDDLPHAAGAGDIDRVKQWFDDSRRSVRTASARHRSGLVRSQQPLRDRRRPARTWRGHQYSVGLARTREHPARARLSRKLRGDAVP
jgi:hypothetical protein